MVLSRTLSTWTISYSHSPVSLFLLQMTNVAVLVMKKGMVCIVNSFSPWATDIYWTVAFFVLAREKELHAL